MSTARTDRWAALATEDAVAAAVQRLEQLNDTAAERHARQRWREIIAPRRGEHIIDVGAGTGEMALDLAQALRPDGELHALDLSDDLLAHTRRRARETGLEGIVRTKVGDGAALPYADQGFDAAICRWVLLHVPNPAQVVAEMRRVLRPGGRLLCVEVDWETLIVHPGDPELTRAIAHANVARQVDGRMGRRLPALLRAAGLKALSVNAEVATDLTGAWLPFLRSRLEVAADAGISRAALDTWLAEVEAAVVARRYFFSFTQFGVAAKVPERADFLPGAL